MQQNLPMCTLKCVYLPKRGCMMECYGHAHSPDPFSRISTAAAATAAAAADLFRAAAVASTACGGAGVSFAGTLHAARLL